MKALKKLLLLATATLFLVNCTTEYTDSNQNEDPALLAYFIKDQTPNPNFDQAYEGLYHGIVASGDTQSRGKIWINLKNDAAVNAYVEMVDGTAKGLYVQNIPDNLTDAHKFVGSDVSFDLLINQDGEPIITNFILENENHFVNVVKDRSQTRAASFTGTFNATADPTFNGTWNLISDGTILNPNGLSGEGITSVVVTFNGNMIIDTTFETFDASTCFPNPFVPIVFNADRIFAENQTSNFGGTTTWSLVTTGVPDEYCPSVCTTGGCNALSGTYSRNGVAGVIYID